VKMLLAPAMKQSACVLSLMLSRPADSRTMERGMVMRATATEEALARGASIAEAAALADQGTSPTSDMHADQEYRRHLARLLTRRALEKAAGAPAAAA